MKTEDLIRDLASRAVPVEPLPAPAVRAFAWSGVAIACAAAGILVFKTRSDVAALLHEPGFLGMAAIALGVAWAAAMASLVMAVPGAERSPLLRATAVVLTGLWTAVLAVAVVRAGLGFARAADWPICFIRVLAIGLVPAIVLVSMLRRAAPLRLGWTAALATAAAMATGALAIQFICPLNDPAHALLGHLGPVLVMSWVGSLAARRVLR
jgi:hypothetical protein